MKYLIIILAFFTLNDSAKSDSFFANEVNNKIHASDSLTLKHKKKDKEVFLVTGARLKILTMGSKYKGNLMDVMDTAFLVQLKGRESIFDWCP